MDFINDIEKMIDFEMMSKEQFLESYSYLTEDDYNVTLRKYNEQKSHEFVNALKELISKPDNLENFEWYLERHYKLWWDKYANTSDGIVSELNRFATIEF